MDKTELQMLVNQGIECCNNETGEYFIAVGVTEEQGKPILILEPSVEEA